MTVEHTYKDTSVGVESRVLSLLEQMTPQEKVAQLYGIWSRDLIDPASRQFVQEKAQTQLAHGIGHITRVGAVSMLPPVQSAQLANDIQRYLVTQTRLGIPGIVHEESCAGYLAKDATTFPQAIGLAATWEPELIQEMATEIRKQMRSVGAHHTLAPVLDVVRDPRWGRVEETFGEDPFLISAIGNAYIHGVQGNDWHTGIIATAKHFIGYGASEGGLNWAPTHIPERELREVYLTPFIAAIKEAKVGSVMNAYQEHDGVPSGSSRWLMVDILRNELGFEGTVVSDYFTINMFVEYHHIAKDKAEAARYGLEAGIDIELPDADCYGQPLLDALLAGDIPMALVDTCVQRVLTQKIQLGILENPYVDTAQIMEVYNTQEQLNLSRTLASKSIVLLKNDDVTLPLSTTLKTIAVIGPSADSARLMQGDYHYPAHIEGIIAMGENMEAPAPGEENTNIDWEEHRPKTTTVLAGIRERVSTDTQIFYAKGCEITGDDTSGFAEAITLAQSADVAIVVVGDISGLGVGSTSGEANDRATLELAGVQQELILKVAETGTPTIVVLLNGRPPVLTEIVDHVPAILQAWLPAQEGGSAIADVLFGDVSPAGRLPMTFPRAVGQVPVYYNHKISGARSHWHGEYMDMTTKPLFPFGHGLSYTTFEYSDLHVTPKQAKAGDTVMVQFGLHNTGKVAGDEVVQLYVNDPLATITRPVKQLKGFKRVFLQAGEQKTLTFHLDVAHLGFYDHDMTYVIEPGTIKLMLGSSSEDIHLNGSFEIIGETTPVEPVFFTPVDIQ